MPGKRPVSGEGLLFPLEKDSAKANAFSMGITVGRTENNDIVLEDNSVSRFHAYFQQDSNQGWKLFDADSSLGTWVGPLKLVPKRPHPLPEMARLRFGNLELFYFMPDRFFEYLQGHLRP